MFVLFIIILYLYIFFCYFLNPETSLDKTESAENFFVNGFEQFAVDLRQAWMFRCEVGIEIGHVNWRFLLDLKKYF